jgi:hypothetical protein
MSVREGDASEVVAETVLKAASDANPNRRYPAALPTTVVLVVQTLVG